METWPSIFPNPNRDFSGILKSMVRRTEMESGRVRQRSAYSRQTREYRAVWLMTDFQFGMFESWVLNKLTRGADSFEISLPTGGEGFKTVEARIKGGEYGHKYDDVMYWSVSATLEVDNSLVWDEDIYDTLLVSGDIVALEAAVAHLVAYSET